MRWRFPKKSACVEGQACGRCASRNGVAVWRRTAGCRELLTERRAIRHGKIADGGVSASVGAPTMSVNGWDIETGPVPVLLSVPVTFRLKLPAAVGVPEMVTLLDVVAVAESPAGRPFTASV